MKRLRSTRQARAGLVLTASLALLATLSLRPAGASDTNQPTRTAAGPWRIVVLGSSTAANAGARPTSMGWVNRYDMYMKTLHPDNEVINRAVGGYTTYHLMPTGFESPEKRPAVVTDRNITYALAQNPDAIIINLPSNDASHATLEQQQENFRVIAGLAAKAGVPLWFSTTQPRNFADDKRAYQAAMRDWILATYGEFAIDFWTGLADQDGRILRTVDSGDGVHLNNAGHALLFQRVAMANLPYKLSGLAPKR